MSMFSFAIMIIAGALAVYGLLQERKGATWGRPLAIVAAAAALIMALFNMFSGGRGPDVEQLQHTQERFQEIAGEKMGRYLAENFAGQKMVALGGVDFSSVTAELGGDVQMERQIWEVYLEGLKKGMGESLEITEVVQLPIPEETRRMIEYARRHSEDDAMPIDDLYMLEGGFADSASAYNSALRPYLREVDIVVALADLPYDIENLEIWRMQNPPKLAVILPGVMHKMQNVIARGFVVGAVAYRPQFDHQDRSIPRNIDDAFDKRFLLITPDNVAEIAAEYETLFR